MRENVDAPRVSLSLLNASGDPERRVRIWLLAAVQRQHVTYYRVVGRLLASNQTWEVQRRYSDFLVLRDTLLSCFAQASTTCPGCLNFRHAIETFAFPKKKWFGSTSRKVIQMRLLALRAFMNVLASWTFSTAPKCPTCGGAAFRLVRNFVVADATPVGGSSMDAIRHSFVASTFVENNAGSNTRATVSMTIPRGNGAGVPSFLRTQSSDDVIRAQDDPRSLSVAMATSRRRNTISDQPEDLDELEEGVHPVEVAKPSSTRRSAPIPSHHREADRGAPTTVQHPRRPRGLPSAQRETAYEDHEATDLHTRDPRAQFRHSGGIVRSHKERDKDSPSAIERTRSDTNVLAGHIPDKRRAPGAARHASLQTVTTPPRAAQPKLHLDDLDDDLAIVHPHPHAPSHAYTRPQVVEEQSDTSSDADDDELEFTGIVTGIQTEPSPSPSPRGRRGRPKANSGENLWQPWELAH